MPVGDNSSDSLGRARRDGGGKLPVTAASLALVVAMGFVDYVTGYEIRLFLFYFVPVALASWFVSRSCGVLIAAGSTLAWAAADVLAGHEYPATAYLFWNCAIQLGAFIFASLTLSSIAAHLETQRELNAVLSERIRRTDQLNADLSREKAKIESANSAMVRDLDMARVVQRAMIPQSVPHIAGLDVAIEYRPAVQVGGDVLNIYPLDRGRTVFFLGDAMGHGVQAALTMAAVNAVARRAVYADPDPARVLAELNASLSGHFEEHFVTAVCCLIDTQAAMATTAIAGHPRPLCVHRMGLHVEELGQTCLPLGVQEDARYEDLSVRLSGGDALVFFTDGLVEARNARAEWYGYERLREKALAAAGGSAQEISDLLFGDVLAYCGDSGIHDDVAMLVIKVQPL